MTNLERARNGERLKVRKSGDYIIRGIDGEDYVPSQNYTDDLINWVNQQIDIAVTHAIDETEKSELWRDLEEGEVYQEGDRIAIHKYDWKIITKDHRFINQSRAITEPLAQRRVRKEDL